MSETNGDSPPRRFRVVASPAVTAQALAARQRAAALGVGAEFVAVLAGLLARLQTDADEMGEPIFDLRHAAPQVRKVIAPPVALHYGVHRVQPVVFVQKIAVFEPRAD